MVLSKKMNRQTWRTKVRNTKTDDVSANIQCTQHMDPVQRVSYRRTAKMRWCVKMRLKSTVSRGLSRDTADSKQSHGEDTHMPAASWAASPTVAR